MSESILVGQLSEIIRVGGRKRLTVRGRDIFIIARGSELFALDSFCYHAGGPLHMGDIEEMPGYTCVVCPWHRYKITLRSGEGLYHSIDPHNLSKPPVLCSKGVKQRTHLVTLEGDDVYVTLSTGDPAHTKLESDQYNSPAS
ncbi:Rieske domain-containing protein [Aplysia californica]|uniref:Rieske domain-containing protein n=1 Tax=Aplysia californica TaxID=6500 RepID=A0ABM0JQ56_APLCA|nr:Rieske domain-containing protein [Aplysia californica]